MLPNPWDVGTARFLQVAGFKALATTSAGAAFSRGLPDTVTAMPCDEVIEHIRELVGATSLPVNADFQAGYADEAEGVFDNVTRCVGTGVAGLSIEDASGDADQPLFERAVAIERVVAARKAIDETATGVVLTARCEAFLVGDDTPVNTALDRLSAFAAAGADCLYAPGVRDVDTIRQIVKAVAPRPVNVLMSTPVAGLNVSVLAELGVRRISIGSAFARVAWQAFMQSAIAIEQTGEFDSLAGAASFTVLNQMFEPFA